MTGPSPAPGRERGAVPDRRGGRRRVWVIPLAGVAAGIVLSFVTVAIDRHYRSGLVPAGLIGNAGDAQNILSTIASAVVPLATTVLTVTLVAVQLAMGQFSPRIVRALLHDRGVQLAISVFGLFFFVNHSGRRLRVAGLVDLVGNQLHQ